MARNQDDHVKNIAFLMNSSGTWRLAPAFDLTFAYNPEGQFTGKHQMSLNGKREGFEENDLLAIARRFNISNTRARSMIEEVANGVSQWTHYAKDAGVPTARIENRKRQHRLY
jgi:serine/threonine-protein kinase HipA